MARSATIQPSRGRVIAAPPAPARGPLARPRRCPRARTPTRPGRGVRTTTRSHSRSASSRSCVTRRTVRGRAPMAAASHSCISVRVIASSAPNGSSRSRTGFSASSVRANATRWRMPPESSQERACSNPSRPSSAKSSAARARASRRSTPAFSSGSEALPRASRQGMRRSDCGMSAHRSSRPFSSPAPPTETAPRSGLSRPATMRSSVDFPHPLRPTSPTVSPAPAPNVTPSSATTGSYAFVTSVTTISLTACIPSLALPRSGSRVGASAAPSQPLRGSPANAPHSLARNNGVRPRCCS